jgi:hypothetical protein
MEGWMILKMTLLTDKKGEKKACKYLHKLYLIKRIAISIYIKPIRQMGDSRC